MSSSDPLSEVLARLSRGLAAQVRSDTGLWDPEDGCPTPPDHYGQLACALTLRLSDPEGPWRECFRAWEALEPQRLGHAPFNRFLLLLLARLNANGHAPQPPPTEKLSLPRSRGRVGEGVQRRPRPSPPVPIPQPAEERIRDFQAKPSPSAVPSPEIQQALDRCRLSRTYPSNNWMLLAQLSRLIEARNPNERERAQAHLLKLYDAWTTPAGGFIDFPRRPHLSKGQLSTPVTYHHKALFVAVMAGWATRDTRWREPIRKLLGWTQLTWDGAGHAGGFGRSTHAVFGEACLLASLVLLGADEERHADAPFGRMLAGLLGRWQRQFRDDDLLALNPASRSSASAGYDGYMHLSVYNAWAAAILAWARHAANSESRPEALCGLLETKTVVSLNEDPAAGLLKVGTADTLCALVSTRGQPPQGFSATEVELRYAGGIPIHLTWRGTPICPPPARVSRRELERRPAAAGWTPLLRAGDVLYGLTYFASVSVESHQGECRVHLAGSPRVLHRVEPGRFGARLLRALDWRVLGGRLGRREALARAELEYVRGELQIRITSDPPVLEQEFTLFNRGQQPIELLNPCGHALISTAPLEERDLEVQLSGRPIPGTEGKFSETALDSSLPNATGYCLPALTLKPDQKIRCRLVLSWVR